MRKLIFVAAILAGILGVSAVAYASIPGPDGVIHGCRRNTDGSIRVIDSTATCPNGWTALNWNQTGPQGPVGPGFGTPYVVQNSVEVAVGGSNPDLGVDVYCPNWQSGERALSGGAAVPSDQDPNVQWVLTRSDVIEENGTNNPIGWRVGAHRFGGTSTSVGSLVAHVICAPAN